VGELQEGLWGYYLSVPIVATLRVASVDLHGALVLATMNGKERRTRVGGDRQDRGVLRGGDRQEAWDMTAKADGGAETFGSNGTEGPFLALMAGARLKPV